MTTTPDLRISMLRHTLATLAYRGGKAIRNAPENFAGFRAAESTRTPAQILAHIGDLLDWALTQARDKEEWRNSGPLDWHKETARFHAALSALDDYLASNANQDIPAERIFQGAIADALTHVGQIAMLRRMAGSPVRGENYSRAEIFSGRLGAEQAAPRFEFD